MNGLWIGAVAALWALVVVVGLLVLGTLRRITPVLERAEESFQSSLSASFGGLEVGTKVASFDVTTIDGASFTEAALLETRTVVLFLGPSCEACERFVTDLEANQIPDVDAQLVVVTDDSESAPKLARATDVTVVVDDNRQLARVFDARLVPRAFVVDAQGTVLAEGRPNEWNELQRLVTGGGGRHSDIAAAALAS
ncbi:MAG: TlpA family protein disulfide reductase [Gaiellaceae bacterium]